MKLSQLRKLRTVVSLIFLVATSILFLDLSGWLNENLADSVLYFQFVPSLLSFLKLPALITLGFALIIILTLLFGRVYCSSICPLGILQDILIYLKTKNYRKRKYKFSSPRDILRYSILAVAVIFLIFGSSYILLLLDPYSNYGRIITQLFRPLVVFAKNLISQGFQSFDSYIVMPAKVNPIHTASLVFSMVILITLIRLTYKKGRIFCNTICPVGAFLGLLSKYSLFKIAVDKNNCNGCGLCERVCKATCISSKDEHIDFSRCVSCYNCFDACPSNGLKFEYRYNKKEKAVAVEKENSDNERRSFLTSLVLFSIGPSLIAYAQEKIKVYTKNKVPVIRTHPVSPPGSLSLEYFTEQCTACHLCVSACPSKVLQPSFLEYGFTGMLQPMMAYTSGYCDYECTLCGEICPNGAIQKVTKENKRTVQIGKVRFIEDNCVVKTQGTDCGACSEHCPTKAVEMHPYDKNPSIRIPVVNEKICVGCGACEHACPTLPYKAIWVESNIVHQVAELPKVEKLEAAPSVEEDFPF